MIHNSSITRAENLERCMYTRGETIQVNVVLHIVLECIAIYFRIAIFDCKKTFQMRILVLAVK